MAGARSIEDWQAIFNAMAGRSKCEFADRVLGDLIGYRSNSTHRADDCEQIGNALIAIMRNGAETALESLER